MYHGVHSVIDYRFTPARLRRQQIGLSRDRHDLTKSVASCLINNWGSGFIVNGGLNLNLGKWVSSSKMWSRRLGDGMLGGPRCHSWHEEMKRYLVRTITWDAPEQWRPNSFPCPWIFTTYMGMDQHVTLELIPVQASASTLVVRCLLSVSNSCIIFAGSMLAQTPIVKARKKSPPYCQSSSPAYKKKKHTQPVESRRSFGGCMQTWIQITAH